MFRSVASGHNLSQQYPPASPYKLYLPLRIHSARMSLCQRLREPPSATTVRWPRSHTTLLTIFYLLFTKYISSGHLSATPLCQKLSRSSQKQWSWWHGTYVFIYLSIFEVINKSKQDAAEAAKEFPCWLVAFRSWWVPLMGWLHRGQGSRLEFNLKIVSPLQEQGKERESSCFASLGFTQVIEVLANNLPTEKEMYTLMHIVICSRR